MSTEGFVRDPGWPTIVELAIERWGQPNPKLSKHDDVRFGAKGSKSVKPSNNTWHDHEANDGGGYVEIHQIVRGPLPQREQKPKPKGSGQMPPWDDVATTYPYHEGGGDLILEVVRTFSGSPRFRQRRPNGKGGWTWSVKDLPGHDRLLYRLPGLRASGDALVWITEGEKDTNRLTDELLIATTNIGGAGKWRDECAAEFRGKHCVVLQDNDKAGRDHADKVARSLAGIAASVKVLLLPGLPEKGDVSDWLDTGGTVEELERLAREAPEYQSEASDGDYGGLTKTLLASTWLSRELPPIDRLLGDFITTTSRAFLVGPAGLGKTMLGLAIAMGIGFGTGYLHWRSSRPARVLYIDGEMPAELLIQRLRDAVRRIGREDLIDNVMVFSTEDAEEIAERWPMLGMIEPLNAEAGQDFIKRLVVALKPDVVIFDNVQALLSGVQKEEETWIPVLALVQWLTKQRIGQLWIDHTARSTGKQYGTSTKSWRFDTVGLMTPLKDDQRAPGETGFLLSFDKARRRAPENWDEFSDHIVRLRDDVWTGEPADKQNGRSERLGKVRPSRKLFHDALIDAIAHMPVRPGETTNTAWEAECERRDLIERLGPDDDAGTRRSKRAALRAAKSDLQAQHWIGVDGERVMDLTYSYR